MKRRDFLKNGAALGTGLMMNGFPSIVRGQNLNSRLNLASIGTGGRAAANIDGVVGEHIVALADVDSDILSAAARKYSAEKTYRDFREMLAVEGDRLDGVLVGTPDHTHAPAAAMALRMGKAVYCEKPLTHTVHESRVLQRLARQHGCVTQMGTQIHAGDNYRRVVELVRSGLIGEIRRVHVWMNASGHYSGKKFEDAPAAPANLDWDLWLGPAAQRPYSPGVHPFAWRGFYEFGNGRLGDFGCHYIDLVHWALDLKHPYRIHARGPEPDDVSTPEWLEVDYDYPSRGNEPPVHLTWYGNRKPEILSELRESGGEPVNWGNGQLFVGDRGYILSDYGKHRVFLKGELFSESMRPEAWLPRSAGHHAEWLSAIREGGKKQVMPTCSFDYSGPLTETVLLGVVSYRSGEIIRYDSESGRVTNSRKADSYLHKEYREGWVL